MMKGTPYIYQGEEIGMTNVKFSSIEDYRDIETLNMYEEKINKGIDPETLMNAIYVKSRDNARTPMQWNDSKHAGFTSGEPWIKVNPNYKEINVEAAIADPDSIFHYYKKLIQLRKKHPIIVYGEYELLLPDSEEIFAYTRKLDDECLLIISNFTPNEIPFTAPFDLNDYHNEGVLIGNYQVPEDNLEFPITLRPYETRVYRFVKDYPTK